MGIHNKQFHFAQIIMKKNLFYWKLSEKEQDLLTGLQPGGHTHLHHHPLPPVQHAQVLTEPAVGRV